MELKLLPADGADLAFARELTRVNMRVYYAQYARVWQPDAFDAEWGARQSFIIGKDGKPVGFISLSHEPEYLYVRDVQLCEPFRGEGIGAWVLAQISGMAQAQAMTCIRLKVFKSNPAVELYRRQGYAVVGQEPSLLWMERKVELG